MNAVQELARLYGVADAYVDYRAQPREVSLQSQAAITQNSLRIDNAKVSDDPLPVLFNHLESEGHAALLAALFFSTAIFVSRTYLSANLVDFECAASTILQDAVTLRFHSTCRDSRGHFRFELGHGGPAPEANHLASGKADPGRFDCPSRSPRTARPLGAGCG